MSLTLPQLNSGANRSPQAITGINVIIDGVGHLGTSKTVTLPKLVWNTEEQVAGGMTRTVDMGVLEKMEASITLEEYSPVVYGAMALRGVAACVFMLNGDIIQAGKHRSFHAVLSGPITEIDDGDQEAKKGVERKITLAVNKYVQEIDGTQIFYVDTNEFICIVDGVDLLQETRNNLRI